MHDARPGPPIAYGLDVTLLSGDDWGPHVCESLASASRSCDIALYSITKNWPKKHADNANILRELIDMPRRGLRCRAVLAAHAKNSTTRGFNFGASRKLQEAGWRLRWADPSNLLHAKYICTDRSRVTMGSHNVTFTAVTKNIDLSVSFETSDKTTIFNDWFDRLYLRATYKF